MSKSLFILLLCLLLVFRSFPAVADGYDDCLDGCRKTVAPCVEQVRLTAGNYQEEVNLIAACENSRDACIQVCRDTEANFGVPPVSQEPPPQQPPPQQPPPQEPPPQEPPPQEPPPQEQPS